MSEKLKKGRLEIIGLQATWLYLILLLGGIPVAAYFGMIHLEPLALNALGDFLAGAFGPLAIFWLVLGFFQQGRELQNSVDALNLQAEELRNSVTQQKALVEITKGQLDLDIETREEQNRLSVSRDLPFFQMRGSGNSGSGTGRTYKFRLRNLGATATEVHLRLNTEVANFGPKSMHFIEASKEVEISITDSDLSKFNEGSDTQLILDSYNLRGQKRTQVFRVGNFAPQIIKCDPEQL